MRSAAITRPWSSCSDIVIFATIWISVTELVPVALALADAREDESLWVCYWVGVAPVVGPIWSGVVAGSWSDVAGLGQP